jgi:sterol desaturase/sphingolipid hydroxylase (fatty acid hydroxylase superfamily)
MGILAGLGPLKTFILAAAVFIPFERLAAAHAGQPILRRGWAMDILTGIANGLLLSAVVLTVLAGVDAVAAVAVPGVRSWVASQPWWGQVILATVVADLGIYLTHRLEHTVPWLWRFHAIHHSAEELDWLVSLRFHPLDAFLMRVGSLAPLIALNVSPAAIAAFIAVYAWQSHLVHANVRLSYGPLRWAFVSPDFHHWHHSAEREAFNKNYSSIFAAWDVVFGTMHLPQGRRTIRYGIEAPMPPGYFGRLVEPLRPSSSKTLPPGEPQMATTGVNGVSTGGLPNRHSADGPRPATSL